MDSRRRDCCFVALIRSSLFRYAKRCRPNRAGLASYRQRVQHIRIAKYISRCEILATCGGFRTSPPGGWQRVKIGSQAHHSSAISSSNAQAIIVRGRDLARELIGQISFTDHCWLLITGSMPSQAQRRMLDATLVAIAEHGLVPSVQASRMTLAAAPEALQGAVAAGILGCGSVVLGSAEAAGRFFSEINQQVGSGMSQEDAATAVIQKLRTEKRAIPGYGHPQHKDGDPRARRLLALAQEVGVAGSFVALARLVESLLPRLLGKDLQMNVSGAIPAVLLDAGFPLLALKGVPILARAAGLIAHLLEEQQRPIGFVLAHSGGQAVSYDGEAPEGFVPADE
jgi:citrate synthase